MVVRHFYKKTRNKTFSLYFLSLFLNICSIKMRQRDVILHSFNMKQNKEQNDFRLGQLNLYHFQGYFTLMDDIVFLSQLDFKTTLKVSKKLKSQL
jgi:hypothetical protein